MSFSDEAWFSLHGEVNAQNWYQSAEDPRRIHEHPRDEATGVQ
jgi:hypothetical protein